MKIIDWLHRFRRSEPRLAKDFLVTPRPTDLLGRSFHLAHEGVVTIIGVHCTKLVPGQHELLRIRVENTGEKCLLLLPYMLGHGLEVALESEPRTESEDCEETVERIIGLNMRHEVEE